MSNLLDKSSIVLTPTAYDNGKVLCVKPSDGSGDFDFSRNSAATRVNAQGLVEDVQILSSNLVQNGSFSQIGSEEITNGNFSQQGSQLITNGDFATDSDWTMQAGWSISNGKLNALATNGIAFQSNLGLVIGKTYKVSLTTSNYVSGSARLKLGGSAYQNISTTDGNQEFYFIPTASNDNIIFSYLSTFTGSIDNVSVVEVGQNWSFVNSTSIGDDKAIISGDGSAFGYIEQTSVFTSGKTYKVTLDAIINSGGGLKVMYGVNFASIIGEIITTGSYTFYYTAASNTPFIIGRKTGGTAYNSSVTNISVKEVGQNWDITQSGNDTILIENQYALFDCPDNSNIFITQSSLLTIGKTYKATFDVLSIDNGGFQFAQGGGGTISGSPTINTTGTHTFTFVAATATFGIKRALGAPNLLNAKITNISAKEITDDTNLPRINYEGFSFQDALGSELVTNGDFSNGTNNWQVEGFANITVGDFKGKTDVAKINILNTATASRIRQPFNYVNGKIYKVDIEVYVENGNFRADCSDSFVSGDFVSTSTLGSWQTLTANITAIATGSNYIWLRSIVAVSEFYISKVSVKEVTGQEVVPDSGCGSWLFEPQSTNLITQSELFSDSYWTKSGASVVSGFISPDGTSNAFKLVEDTSNGVHRIGRATFTANVQRTLSVFAKKGERDYISLFENNFPAGIIGVIFNLNNGTHYNTKPSYYSNVKIELISNGWYKCSVTMTNGGLQVPSFGVSADGLTNSYTGDGTSGIYIFGAQLEEQTYATSYIPTDGTSVTRNQDVCIGGGSAASINSSEGVLYAEIAALANDLTDRDISISDGTNNNVIRIRLSRFSNNIGYSVLSNGTATVGALVSGQTQTNTNKIAVKYKLNNFSLWINGVEVATDTSGNTPIGLSNLRFSTGNIALPFFGKTKAVAVWKETLTDTELQELTTI